MLCSRDHLIWRELGSMKRAPSSACGKRMVIACELLAVAAVVHREGQRDCSSSWKEPEEGVSELKCQNTLVQLRLGWLVNVWQEIMLRYWTCMDRKLFSQRILKSCVAGSLLVISAFPAGSLLPLKRKFQGYCIAFWYFMLRSSPCRHHTRIHSPEK